MLTRKMLVGIAGAIVAILLAGFGPALGQRASESSDQTGESTKTAPIPAQAKAVRNPIPKTSQSIENGQMWFSSQCTMCHGKSGRGDGDLVERLKLEVPDLTDAGRQNARTDGEYFYILTEGHGRMPGQGNRLEDQVKWDLVNYIRTLPGRK